MISYFEIGLDPAVAFGPNAFSESFPIEGKGVKELSDFTKKVNYVLHCLKQADRPSAKTPCSSGYGTRSRHYPC